MSGLRISGGAFRGRHVPLPSHDLRPTSNKARQACFNIIGPRINDAVFLDLFSGSGIFAVEAISRGASAAYAIDRAPEAVRLIAELAREWKLPLTTMASDAISGIKRLPKEIAFDVVFADPPYDYARYADLLEGIDAGLKLAPGAVVVLEHHSKEQPPKNDWRRLRPRKTSTYGEVALSIYDSDINIDD